MSFSSGHRPKYLKLANLDYFPQVLRDTSKWTVWLAGADDPKTGKFVRGAFYPNGKFDKKPKGSDGTGRAWNTDPRQLMSFDAAVFMAQKGGYDGIGMALPAQTADGMYVVAFDFDEMKSLDAAKDPRAADIWALWEQQIGEPYVEISPSGTGLHMLVLSKTPVAPLTVVDPRGGKDELFCMSGGRFITVTCNEINVAADAPPRTCPDATQAVAEIRAEWATRKAARAPAGAQARVQAVDPDLAALGPRPAWIELGTTVAGLTLQAPTDPTQRAELIDDLRSALRYLKDKGALDGHDPWANAAHHLKCLGKDGEALWMGISQHDKDYPDDSALRAKWNDCKGDRSNYKSIFTWAQKEAWENPAAERARLQALAMLPPSAVRGVAPQTVQAAGTCTDSANADRLAALLGDKVMRCAQTEKWYVFSPTSGRWRRTDPEKMLSLVDTALRTIADEARTATDEGRKDDAKRLLKWRDQSMNAPKLRAALELLPTRKGVQHDLDALDKYPHLLQTSDGQVIDLKLGAGSARPAQVADRLTQAVQPAWDSAAQCPVWLRTLDAIFKGDADLISFFQRLCGYMLTGETREQKLVFLYGHGANGKSTMVNALREVMGSYATTIPPAALMLAYRPPSGDAPSPTLARLPGIRFVAASETNEGQWLDEVMVKNLTGGEAMAARANYGDQFTYTPQCKLVISGNHKPAIRDTTDSIWRRIVLIPCTAAFHGAAMDAVLPEKLRAEHAGILRWMVEGAREWYAHGLRIPASLAQATQAYRSEMDVIEQWVKEECTPVLGGKYDARAAYESYRVFAERGGSKPRKNQWFYNALREKGYPVEPGTANRQVILGLAAPAVQDVLAAIRARVHAPGA